MTVDDHREARSAPSARWSTASTATGCSTTTPCRPGPSTRWRPTARSCSATCTSTTPRRWPSAGSWAGRDVPRTPSTPRSSGSRSTRRRTPRPPYLRGTFDWHIDGCTDDIPIMATILSAHAVAARAARPSSPAPTQAYDDLDDDEKERVESVRVVHTSRRPSGCTTPTRPPEQVEMWRQRPVQGAPARLEAPVRPPVAGARRHRPTTSSGWTRTRAGRSSTTSWPGRPRPSASTATSGSVGDMVIWDNRGVLHRACPLRPDVAPRHAPHDPAGDEPIQ